MNANAEQWLSSLFPLAERQSRDDAEDDDEALNGVLEDIEDHEIISPQREEKDMGGKQQGMQDCHLGIYLFGICLDPYIQVVKSLARV